MKRKGEKTQTEIGWITFCRHSSSLFLSTHNRCHKEGRFLNSPLFPWVALTPSLSPSSFFFCRVPRFPPSRPFVLTAACEGRTGRNPPRKESTEDHRRSRYSSKNLELCESGAISELFSWDQWRSGRKENGNERKKESKPFFFFLHGLRSLVHRLWESKSLRRSKWFRRHNISWHYFLLKNHAIAKFLFRFAELTDLAENNYPFFPAIERERKGAFYPLSPSPTHLWLYLCGPFVLGPATWERKYRVSTTISFPVRC